jgi:Fe-Mn family superoxide dismutase
LVPGRRTELAPLALTNPLVGRGLSDLNHLATLKVNDTGLLDLNNDSGWPFRLPPLPYWPGALDCAIDQMTIEIHHGRHHKRYVDNLNAALEGQAALASKPIVQLLKEIEQLSQVPAAIRQKVINNGGGHANHTMFWESMSPRGGGEPSGPLAEQIKAVFGDFTGFKRVMKQAACTRFGSGWAWLGLRDGNLRIWTTAYEDSPLMMGMTPLLGFDFWEHAYYLRYRDRLADYVDAWWKVVDWSVVAQRFAAATLGKL